MTPANIAGMAAINGLNIVALCDHNTVKNCPAFFHACKANGIIPIAGMELTTAEDIHIICLFKSLDAAVGFGEQVDKNRNLIPNRTDIFGNQYIIDSDDNIAGTDENLLPNATNLTLEQGVCLCRSLGGVCYPAHVDRQANGIIATLGTFPDEPHFSCVEFNCAENIEPYLQKYPNLRDKKIIVSSDAHYLWNINEADNSFELDDEPYSSTLVRERLFEVIG
jgi:DNA polymerase III alpha subunit